MDAARRILLLEGGMGLLWIFYGFVLESPATVRDAWWLAAVTAVATAVGMYAEDHLGSEWEEWRRTAVAIMAVLTAVVIAGVLVAVTDLAVSTVTSVGIGGMGVGLLGYRLVYGVVLPIPEQRLERSREQSV